MKIRKSWIFEIFSGLVTANAGVLMFFGLLNKWYLCIVGILLFIFNSCVVIEKLKKHTILEYEDFKKKGIIEEKRPLIRFKCKFRKTCPEYQKDSALCDEDAGTWDFDYGKAKCYKDMEKKVKPK
jgi:hypothetical protein